MRKPASDQALRWPRETRLRSAYLLLLLLLLANGSPHGGVQLVDATTLASSILGQLTHTEPLIIGDSRSTTSKGIEGTSSEPKRSQGSTRIGAGTRGPLQNGAPHRTLQSENFHPSTLERAFYGVLRSSVVESTLAGLKYLISRGAAGTDKLLLRQADSAGFSVGIMQRILLRNGDRAESLSRKLRQVGNVRRFIVEFSGSMERSTSLKASVQRLLSVRSDCAKLALGGYEAHRAKDFVQLVSRFRQDYFHHLGFVANCLLHLPRSLQAVGLFVDRVLVPLQETLKSLASTGGRFKGFRSGVARLLLASWIDKLSRLDAAVLDWIHQNNLSHDLEIRVGRESASTITSLSETDSLDSREGNDSKDAPPK